MGNKPKIVVIAGPTGVGKSSLGIELANAFNGEIISADSMQIYRGLDIGTGKVSKEEQKQAVHHLIDILSPDYNDYSVNNFVEDARKKIYDIISRGKLPIIVGGTGLYIKALLNGYTFANSKRSEELTEKYEKIALEKGNEYVHDMLKKIDKISADRIEPNKLRAVIRAITVYEETGKKFSEQNDKNNEFDYLLIGLNLDRDELYKRIDYRMGQMFNEGLVEEFEKLYNSGLTRDNKSMQSICYKELFDYKEGKTTLSETIKLVQQHSRNYAKRQITWLKKMDNINWYSPNDKVLIIEKVKKFIER